MKLLLGLYTFVLPFWAVNSRTLSSDSCHIAAWVRAPDLGPGQIIPGQVRIKASGACDPISEYSIILRFKERAWVKLSKPDIALPQHPDSQTKYSNISEPDRNSVFRPSNSLWSQFSSPLWGKYTQDMSDPTLWDVIEEERIAFESKYRLNGDIAPFSLGEGLTHDFTLLVPTTNYPPTLWMNHLAMPMNEGDTAEKGDEHIYLYTVEIKFHNGTTIEVPAGYTAFKTTGRNDNLGPEVITANFTQGSSSSNDLNASLTINVTFPHGRTLEQGSTYNLTFTLCDQTLVPGDTQTNYSLALGPPVIDLRTSPHDHWIQTLSPMNNYTTSPRMLISCQLSPTSSLFEQAGLCGIPFPALFEDGADISTWNVSTSKSFQVARKAFPSFDMHYGSFESRLSISVLVPIQETKNQTRPFDEEYYWVPTTPTTVAEKENKFFMSLTTEIPITISSNAKLSIPITHYLSSHARRPLFIDQSTIEELSQLSIEERDLLAPKSIPIIKRNMENVIRQRYFDQSLYYVGDTWHRKVLNGVSQSDSDPSGEDGSSDTLLVQVPRN